MTKEKVITFFEDDDWKQGRQFLLRKNRVTSWVTAPGDTNPSDATVMFSQKLFLWFGLLNFNAGRGKEDCFFMDKFCHQRCGTFLHSHVTFVVNASVSGARISNDIYVSGPEGFINFYFRFWFWNVASSIDP